MRKIELINVKDIIKNSDYILKIVTSIGLFDNYDMFHNIYEQYEEPCRRIVVITKESSLEEVYEEKNKTLPFSSYGHIWIKEFPIAMSLHEIDLDNIYVTTEEYDSIKAMIIS